MYTYMDHTLVSFSSTYMETSAGLSFDLSSTSIIHIHTYIHMHARAEIRIRMHNIGNNM